MSVSDPTISAGRCAFPRRVPVTQRHIADQHHLEANLRSSAAWTGLLEAHGSLVEVLVETASGGGTGTIVEQPRLAPLPDKPCETGIWLTPRVDRFSQVTRRRTTSKRSRSHRRSGGVPQR